MKQIFKPLLIASLLATVALGADAQGIGPMMDHGRMDPAKMQQRSAKHQAELKARLKISAAQEGAWAAYVAAMQPAADLPGAEGPDLHRKMRDEMAKLSTPERIDRMGAIRVRHDTEFARRGEATKAFYATLSPEQQKVFDAETLRGGPGGGRPWHLD